MSKPSAKTRHSLRNPKGQFSPSADNPVIRWNLPGALGFAHWIKEVQPHVLTARNRYEPFRPTPKQLTVIKKALAASESGNFLLSMIILIWPRRHGKSTLLALIVLWLITSRKNTTIQLIGNSEQHTKRVQFNTLTKIIRHTPKLRLLIPEKNIYAYDIRFPKLGNVIQMSAVSSASSFGDKLDVLWVSDLHACPDMAPFNALQAALLDSEDSLCLIDSNVDPIDGSVHALQKEAETDAAIFADHVFYSGFEEYSQKAPPWINRQKARRLERTTLPTDFKRDILGQRSDAQNALFPDEVITLCKSKYKAPVSDLTELTQGRSYKVGGGLDRSKSLVGGDNTVWTVVLKVASPEHGEPEIFLLSQTVFKLNLANSIKKQILKDHERYNLDNVVLENYEVTDIKPWLDDQKIPNELISAHDTNQNASFPEFYRIAKEGRFSFPETLAGLESEMRTFAYTQKTGGKYSFGHASQRFKDDRVYSTNWAIFSLRHSVMSLYTLGHIDCRNKSTRRAFCFLMGGELALLCKETCPAYQKTEALFREYKKFKLDDDITLPDFFETKVKLEGARIYQVA